MRCPKCGYTTFEFEVCPKCEASLESGKGTDIYPVEKGGFWIRLVAFIIDIIVILILSRVAGIAVKLGGVTINLPEERIDYLSETLGYYIVMLLIVFYFTLFTGWDGQTFGKMLLRLRVTRMSGEPIGYGRAFLRYLGYHICFLTVGLGFLMIAVDRNKRGLHDLIAGTCVIKVKTN